MRSLIEDFEEVLKRAAERSGQFVGEGWFWRGERQELWSAMRSEVRMPCVVVDMGDVEGSERGASTRRMVFNFGGRYDGKTRYRQRDGRAMVKERMVGYWVVDQYERADDYVEIRWRMRVCEEKAERLLAGLVRETWEGEYGGARLDDIEGSWHEMQAERMVGYKIGMTVEEVWCPL